MTKILDSGLEVDTESYYQLLEWKDKNMDDFILFCEQNLIWDRKYQNINSFNRKQYVDLIFFSNSRQNLG